MRSQIGMVAAPADYKTTIQDIAAPSMAAEAAPGHPMGHFELMDLVSIHVSHLIRLVTYEETGAHADLPHAAAKDLHESGWHGRKAGRGWYSYDASGNKIQ